MFAGIVLVVVVVVIELYGIPDRVEGGSIGGNAW